MSQPSLFAIKNQDQANLTIFEEFELKMKKPQRQHRNYRNLSSLQDQLLPMIDKHKINS